MIEIKSDYSCFRNKARKISSWPEGFAVLMVTPRRFTVEVHTQPLVNIYHFEFPEAHSSEFVLTKKRNEKCFLVTLKLHVILNIAPFFSCSLWWMVRKLYNNMERRNKYTECFQNYISCLIIFRMIKILTCDTGINMKRFP